MMSIRSVHSRRAVSTQRSAKALARGACGGVLMTSMSAAVNTVSKTAVNLVSRSRSRNRSESARWSRSISRFRACLGYPRAGGVSAHPDDVDLAGRQLQEEQHVDPSEEHRVDGEEITRQDAVGLGAQE